MQEKFLGEIRFITGADLEPEEYGLDICVTFQAINGCLEGLQAICRNFKTLVIADELHHASGVAHGKKKQTVHSKKQNTFWL